MKTTPMNIQIQTTSRCNANCIICPYPESWHCQNPGIINDKIFFKIIHEISGLKINKICPYFQNDPFTDKKIIERIKALVKHLNFKTLEISTNASGLTPDKADRLSAILENVPHEIWLSFHGINEITHEGIMGLNYEKCLNHIIYLLKITQNRPLNVKIVGAGRPMDKRLTHPFNFPRSEYMDFWSQMFSRNGIKHPPRVIYFEYHDRAGSIKRNSINLGKTIRPDLKNFYCPRIDQWLHFLYNGDMILCCDDYKREQVFGNICKHSRKDILDGERYCSIKKTITWRN